MPASLTTRHTLVALFGTAATALLIGLPMDVLPNPVFGRAVPVTWWSYPTLAVVAVLSGLLLATKVRPGGDVLESSAAERMIVSGRLSSQRSRADGPPPEL